MNTAANHQRELLLARYHDVAGGREVALAAKRIPTKEEVQLRLDACLGPPACEFLVEGQGCYGCSACRSCANGQYKKILFTVAPVHFWCPHDRWPQGPPMESSRNDLSILLMANQGYRDRPSKLIHRAIERAGGLFMRGPCTRKPKELAEALKRLNFQPRAVMTWEEHAGVFCNNDWLKCIDMLAASGVVPLSVDFGYFDHYQSFLVDRYQSDGTSTIRADWATIPGDAVRWDWAEPRLIKYRDKVLSVLAKAREAGPLEEPPYTLIWTQAGVGMARKPFREGIRDKHGWLRHLCEVVEAGGRRPVVKTTPIRMGPRAPEGVKCYDGKVPFAERRILNARLALFAEDNILLTSSVSNELVLWGLPVTALGTSWFTGLDVFHEPASWEAISNGPQFDEVARTKWMNWWLRRQCYADGLAQAVQEVLDGVVGRPFDDFPYKGLYDAVYNTYGIRYRMSAKRFQEATPLLEEWVLNGNGSGKRVLDIGCGWGEMVQWMERQGLAARGVDIIDLPDREPKEHYAVGDARDLPFGDDSFDATTCFDVLEHLTPGDIHRVLQEARRVARRAVIVVMKGDDPVHLVPGWPRLHQTVRGDGWWRASVQAAGWTILEERRNRRAYAAHIQRT